MSFVLRWPDQPGKYARLLKQPDAMFPTKAEPVDVEEATHFESLDIACEYALFIDSQDTVREWRGCIQEVS